MPKQEDVNRWKQEEIESSCMLPWSEFSYMLFSHLISEECPRELAMEIERHIFKTSWMPFENRMEEAINVFIGTEGPDEANEKLTALLMKWKG